VDTISNKLKYIDYLIINQYMSMMPLYIPNPTRDWYRVQPVCSSIVSNSNLSKQMLEKGNVLQYKKNSSNLTKNQKYSLIAKGKWINRTKTYASQTDVCSNPNTNSLRRVDTVNMCNGISSSFQYDILNPFRCNEKICYDPLEDMSFNTIVDGGILIGTDQVNPCTQVLEKRTFTDPCNLTSASDVPGPIQTLCWDLRLEPWYAKERYIMNTSGNKWPTNYKNFNVAYVPNLVLVSKTSTTVTLSWTYCFQATRYILYQVGAPPRNVSGLTYTVTGLTSGQSYSFYLVAAVTNAASGPSNVVQVTTS
jgi:hypothetical protein